MRYYKFIDKNNIVEFTDKFIVYKGRIYVNPTQEIMKLIDYKPLVIEDKPSYNPETQYLTYEYIDEDNYIRQVWIINDFYQEEEIEILENEFEFQDNESEEDIEED